LNVGDVARTAVRARLDLRSKPFVALGIAASDHWKKWDPASFAELASRLLAAGWPALILLGGAAERPDAAAVLDGLGPADKARVSPVLGWDLREVAALLREAAFYVGNDTAVLNVAAAVGTRAYGLFGGTPVLRHSPSIVPVVPPGGSDRDGGMARISVDAVLNAIREDRGGHGDSAQSEKGRACP
jgi:heptosyltransferase-2